MRRGLYGHKLEGNFMKPLERNRNYSGDAIEAGGRWARSARTKRYWPGAQPRDGREAAAGLSAL